MLKGKVAVVTGGAKGIGHAIVMNLALNGANIVVNYAGSEQAAIDTVAQCEKLGVKAIHFKADISKSDEVEALMKAAVDAFGRIDILVNNAGITKDNLIIKMSEEDFDDVINTNLKGAFLCMKHVARVMMKQRYGKIVNISSVVGKMGNAGQMNYAASKAGLIGMTKTMARELASRNVCVNAVAPGFIETDMTKKLPENVVEAMLQNIPLARFGQVEEVADLVSFLASDKSSYITGQVISVDGGMTMQ